MLQTKSAGVLFWLAFGCCSSLTAAVPAQTQPAAPRLITVEGVQTRVWTAGIEQRKPGQPVIVLEAGSGADLDTWKAMFADIARAGPVVAYDRRALGQSGPDTETPTLRRIIQTLHAVLAELRTSPPYVLVGHSWGGVIIRGFSDMYPKEAVGLVYLDVPDFETTREERAAAVPAEDRQRMLAPMEVPPIPSDTPPGLRAVYEQQLDEMRNDYPTARTFRQPPGIPVAVVVTTRADRLRGLGGVMVRLHIAKQSEWALSSPNGVFMLAGHTGHQVHRDDPALVVRLIEHVLRHAFPAPK
jgi:pimeloyl-ACP methyl ester carboxylesterase